jgi:protocatechuate 3,4-dioxygenase beta subunit
MRDKRIVIVVGIVVIAAAALWWHHRGTGSDTPATQAATPGDATSSRAITPVSVAPRELPASLEVTVKDASGPLAGAIVRIAPEEGDVLVATTDARGIVLARPLTPGAYQISASAAEHEPAAAADQQLAPGATTKIELVLAPGGRLLTGLVTDVSGGPVAGVRIDAAKLGAMARPVASIATTTTGEDGRYRLTVAEGQLLVAARSADYAPQSRYVDVGPQGATADFALVPGGVIEGVVLDERTREPVAGAVIGAHRDRSAMLLAEAGGHRAVADTAGRFRLTGLPPGAYELEAHGEVRRSRAPTVIGLGVAEQLADVELLIGRGARIRGTVVDEAGAAVSAARVLVLGARGGDATTDAAGAFALDGVAPGKLALIARGPGHVAASVTPVEVKDADVDGVVVRVRRGVTLRGRVEPPQVAEVRFEPERRAGRMLLGLGSVTTGADGTFELGPALPGSGTLTARAASGDQGSLDVTVAEGMPELVVTLSPGGSIAGRVVDGRGKPVAGASVMAQAIGAGEHTMIVNGRITSGVQAITSDAGAFELRGLAAGSYRLGVLDRGRPLRLRAAAPVVKLAAAERKTGVELAVDRPDGVIEGVVLGPDGTPLADAWVSVHQDLASLLDGALGGGPGRDPGGKGESRMVMVQAEGDEGGDAAAIAPVLTDAQGRFRIAGLAHAAFTVVAEARAGALRGRVERVTPNANLTIRAVGVASLSGTVRGPSGPAALFDIELDGPTRTQRSFTGGTFTLGRVDPGDYTVRVTSSEGNAEVKVTIAPDTPAKLDIVLTANAIVVGTVVDADGKPVPDVPVTVIEDSGGDGVRVSMTGPPPTTGADGKFRIEHKAGRATLVVMTPPQPILRRGLVLEAGKTLDVGTIELVTGGGPPGPPPQR